MMDLQTLLAATSFAVVTSITPGPNNMMLLASGVNHGFKATLPHVMGISSGLLFLFLAAGLGLGALLTQWPQLYWALKGAGLAYMVWLAWQLWRAGGSQAQGAAASSAAPRLMGFWGAVAFQWVNPKAWLIAIGAVAGFLSPGAAGLELLALALLCALVNMPCVGLWAWAGARLSRWLSEPLRRRYFNATTALLLLASIWPMLNV